MRAGFAWQGYAWSVAATAACTLAGLAMRSRFDIVNIAMVYVLAVVVVALRFPRGPAFTTAMLSVLAFDYAFVPPSGTFTVDDVQYLLTFAIMLAVALVVSRLVESVKTRAAAQAALELEAETERIRSALLASISHDLRTPLAVMAGASSSLAESGEQLSADERRALANSVFQQARRMSDHVAKILQMTRLENGAIVLERDWSSMAEIVGSVLARLRERLSLHRVIVEVPSELPLVRIDASLVEQALGNLLENAASHTPAGTVVRLRVERRGDELVVIVEDYGGAIADVDVARVFDKFEHGRAEGSAGGVGLGLAICRAIVRLHDGRASAQRMPGGGTAFSFTLPLEPAPPPPA